MKSNPSLKLTQFLQSVIQYGQFHGFLDVTECAHIHRFLYGFIVPIGREHDDTAGGLDLLHPSQDIDTPHPRHADVQQDDIGKILLETNQSILTRIGGLNLVAPLGKKNVHQVAYAWFIINDENMVWIFH